MGWRVIKACIFYVAFMTGMAKVTVGRPMVSMVDGSITSTVLPETPSPRTFPLSVSSLKVVKMELLQI